MKHVSIRIPRCTACSSGAVLVDLPGIGDSNAARDKIAKNVCMETSPFCLDVCLCCARMCLSYRSCKVLSIYIGHE